MEHLNNVVVDISRNIFRDGYNWYAFNNKPAQSEPNNSTKKNVGKTKVKWNWSTYAIREAGIKWLVKELTVSLGARMTKLWRRWHTAVTRAGVVAVFTLVLAENAGNLSTPHGLLGAERLFWRQRKTRVHNKRTNRGKQQKRQSQLYKKTCISSRIYPSYFSILWSDISKLSGDFFKNYFISEESTISYPEWSHMASHDAIKIVLRGRERWERSDSTGQWRGF